MSAYTYVANASPRDRFEQISLQMDNGSTVVIRKGNSYDLSANELARAQRYVIMQATSVVTAAPVVTARLPIIGDMQDGQVPVWDSSLGAFVPGAGGGGGSGNTRTLLWDANVNNYDHLEWHADFSEPRQFNGPVYPVTAGITMVFGDTWTSTEAPAI